MKRGAESMNLIEINREPSVACPETGEAVFYVSARDANISTATMPARRRSAAPITPPPRSDRCFSILQPSFINTHTFTTRPYP